MSFTAKQGQYLAFICCYTEFHGRAPAEAVMALYFRVSPAAVHQMVLMLEKARLITRVPGVARSIQLRVPREDIQPLD